MIARQGFRRLTAGPELATASEIELGGLVFVPDSNATGSPYGSFTFQVKDDGGTADGRTNIDISPKTMTISVLQAVAVTGVSQSRGPARGGYAIVIAGSL